ncbi:hypothetical protein C6401_11340 [Arthrobacter woluwensis]|uniref:hypothetical protein n=1 Tax=Arthrobacter woluwensis TaxID=156980 RepID=UPI000D12C084|nr:hypothetical protein [Arthrobacter woluwensis]PSS43705.1 hypothetical protein C6401_11340 [Arthrobacter woluwensis]
MTDETVVLRHDLPWTPWVVCREGRLLLRVPVWLRVADTVWDFEVTAEQVAALGHRSRLELLKARLEGVTDRDMVRAIIDDIAPA